MAKSKQKYGAEVHFGLLLIIFILLLVNVVTNYTLFNARQDKRSQLITELSSIALTISRNLNQSTYNTITETQIDQIIKKYNLSDFFIIPEIPPEIRRQNKRAWLESVIHNVPMEKLPDVAGILFSADEYVLKRGNSDNFYYCYPFRLRHSNHLLLLSQHSPELAYLEDTAFNIFIISISALILLVLVYFRLYRYIIAPFNAIRKEASKAGRDIVGDSGDVESIVTHYQAMIKELQEKEQTLLNLNKAITQKADNLETYNQYLLDSMLTGVVSLDRKGNIQAVNNAAVAIIKKPSQSLVGKNIHALDDFPVTILREVEYCLSTEAYLEYTEFTEHFAGRELSLGVSIAPVDDEQNHRLGLSLLMHDLTELTKLRMDAERNNQLAALGEMSAGLAHQLRNSIGALTGFNRLLGKKLEKSNHDTQLIADIATELSEAESMIAKFLSFTRPFEYNPENINLSEWLTQLISQCHVTTLYPDINLILDTPEGLQAKCAIDKILMKQAITNIIENGAQAYNDTHGQIKISCLNKSGALSIEIADQAGGIDTKVIDKIFTPFYSTNPAGSGLGLPLAKKIIALHNGHLTVDTVPGVGTTFEISLPLVLSAVITP